MAYKVLKSPGPLGDYSVLEIEHILPNNPETALRAAFVETNPNALYDDYKSRLGNLTLLEKPINIVAGRDYFAGKKSEYSKSKNYLTSGIAEIEVVGKNSSINRMNANLKSFDHWNAESIEQRHELLTTLARGVWKIVPIEAS
jgi:hypothetical protein